MAAIITFQHLKHFLPIAGVVGGAALALLVALLPQWRLESLVESTGLGTILRAARPPLGATARSAIALAAGGLVAGLGFVLPWLADRMVRKGEAEEAPVLRRADAHPDAPARRPLRASEELGRPLPIVAPSSPDRVSPEIMGERGSVRAVPVNLDTPLARFDPDAILPVPREPVRPVTPLVRSALPASVPPPPASINALLDRLERGATQRCRPTTPPPEEALGTLRDLAPR